MKDNEKSFYINCKITESVYTWLRALADEQKRSMAAQLKLILEKEKKETEKKCLKKLKEKTSRSA